MSSFQGDDFLCRWGIPVGTVKITKIADFFHTKWKSDFFAR